MSAGKWVTLVIDRDLPPRYDFRKGNLVKKKDYYTRLYNSYIDCQPLVQITSAEDNIIDFDNYSLNLVSSKKIVINKNKIPMNASFESGFQGRRIKFFESPTREAGKNKMLLDSDAAHGNYSLKLVKGVEKINKRNNYVAATMIVENLPIQKKYTLSFCQKVRWCNIL